MATPVNVTDSGCLRKSTVNGTVYLTPASGSDGRCPGTLSPSGNYRCCASNAVCLSDGICFTHYPRPGGSGFYMSACTDSSYRDADACTSRCTNQVYPAITYLNASGLWTCCGTDAQGAVSCVDPTDNTFYAPSPQDLLRSSSDSNTGNATASNNATTSSSTTSSSSTTQASAANASTTGSPVPPHPWISSGAIAGIVVGVVALIAIILAAIWFTRRRRRKTTNTQDHVAPPPPVTDQKDSGVIMASPHTEGKHELPHNEAQNTWNSRSARAAELP